MSETFLHGVEVVTIDDGPRPVQTVRSAVIGLVGTAPDADADKFPLNVPVLIAGRRGEAAGLGSTGTLPAAIDDIFDQAGAVVVVVRVTAGANDAATMTSVKGGVGSGGGYEGVHALLSAESAVGVTPKILIAPGFTHQVTAGPPRVANAVVAEMVGIAERLRAVIVADGPNTTDAAALQYRGDWGSKRVYVVDPHVLVSGDTVTARPASARVAGLIAKTDAERGFWWSPSNQVINGIVGVARPIDFSLGDPNSRANLLNEKEVATIIRQDGFRLWGNRTCSSDPKWAFLSVVRTADMINESILQAHLWAVDRCITKTYVEDVGESVRAYLRSLKARGAIINGSAWVDPDVNTAADIAAGRVTFDFDFSAPSPAERVTFRSRITDRYLTEVLAS